jgi:urea carboxylase-associated protein 2
MRSLWHTRIEPGGKWSGRIGRGQLVRFTASNAGANLSMLLYNAEDGSERYNMPDTLKAQYTSHLTKGNVLMSDNGRVLASIVQDTLGWHDTISGCTTRAATDERYGKTTYQEQRNGWLRSGYENFAAELVRCGLGLRDLVPNVNLFSKVYCDDQGSMHYVEGYGGRGAAVTLRTEMDTVFILSNTPNPLDPRGTYPSVPIEVEISPASQADTLDDCVNYRPENRRAFENTWDYVALLGR